MGRPGEGDGYGLESEGERDGTDGDAGGSTAGDGVF